MPDDSIHSSTAGTLEAAVIDKLVDAETPGYWAEFTSEEAAMAGFFQESAISEEAADDASFDNPNVFADDER